MKRFIGRLGRRSAVAVVVGLAVTGGIAYATIPDGAGVYTACKLNATGTIRLIDPSLPATNLLGHCTSFETKITWSGKGQAGPAGPVGPAGNTGPQGPKGDTGAKGETGATGAAGADGAQGPKGDAGAKGETGATGAAGADGAQGPKGDVGATGPQGPTGPAGPAGAAGSNPAADAYDGQFGSFTNGGRTTVNGPTCMIGQIQLTAGAYAAGGSYVASGELLPINQQNSGLFLVIGNTYGGNGTTTFAVPDMRAITPNHMTYSICYSGIFPQGQ